MPYWLSAQDGAVKNNVDLQGQWLLTGSNMSVNLPSTKCYCCGAFKLWASRSIWPCQSESRSDNAVDECADNVPIPRLTAFSCEQMGQTVRRKA